jgi:uncharacterized protein YbaP (TraB family)
LSAGWRAALMTAALLVYLPGGAANAAPHHHTLWAVRGAHNTVYLLGSVHVLKPGDSDLPPEALRAYQRARALVMELDLNDPAAVAKLASDPELERLPAGQTLAAALGAEVYERFAAQARSLEVDPASLQQWQPWFAATILEQADLERQGFQAGAGVDEQLAQRAAADHKPIIGLETVEQQLGIFAHMSLDEQRRFVLYMLDDADDSEHSAEAVISAWRGGDVPELERLLTESLDQYPELFRMLTTDRNRRWLPIIEQQLQQSQDSLVVVGALHLVGPSGLVQLLRDAGYTVEQQ